MSIVAEAVYNAFKPEKLNYGGPVWQLEKDELFAEKYLPDADELEALKSQLNIELDKLL